MRLHTHLSGDAADEPYCLDLHGVRPVEWFESLGWASPRTWVAHCFFPDDAEIARLGAAGVGVAHCATAGPADGGRHRAGASRCGGRVPVGHRRRRLVQLRHGRRCGMEARMAMIANRFRSGPAAFGARDALELATRGGAACLGRTGEIGELSPGANADLVRLAGRGAAVGGRGVRPGRRLAALRPVVAAARARRRRAGGGRLRVDRPGRAGVGRRAGTARCRRAATAVMLIQRIRGARTLEHPAGCDLRARGRPGRVRRAGVGRRGRRSSRRRRQGGAARLRGRARASRQGLRRPGSGAGRARRLCSRPWRPLRKTMSPEVTQQSMYRATDALVRQRNYGCSGAGGDRAWHRPAASSPGAGRGGRGPDLLAARRVSAERPGRRRPCRR